jgi:hypothetical protein
MRSSLCPFRLALLTLQLVGVEFKGNEDPDYRIHLTPEPKGGYTVTVLALQGCVTWGQTTSTLSRRPTKLSNSPREEVPGC